MSVPTESSAAATAIRPFTIKIPEAEIDTLRARIAAGDPLPPRRLCEPGSKRLAALWWS